MGNLDFQPLVIFGRIAPPTPIFGSLSPNIFRYLKWRNPKTLYKLYGISASVMEFTPPPKKMIAGLEALGYLLAMNISLPKATLANDVPFPKGGICYTSSHNHGSENWVPPIVVPFHFG